MNKNLGIVNLDKTYQKKKKKEKNKKTTDWHRQVQDEGQAQRKSSLRKITPSCKKLAEEVTPIKT